MASPLIHPSSIVASEAQISEDVTIGPFCVIGPQVTLGAGSILQSHVSIEGKTTIGRNNYIYPFCYLGMPPQELSASSSAGLVIGDRNMIRQHVSIAVSTIPDQPTQIGNDVMIMGHSHIAHDCRIGDRVIITHGVGLSGHVTIEEGAVLGGQAGAHQFVRVGRYAMVGGKTGIICDIPPFTKVAGLPPRYLGCNHLGLRRAGFGEALICELTETLEVIFNPSLTLQSWDHLETQNMSAEVLELIHFIRNSQRGVCALRSGKPLIINT